MRKDQVDLANAVVWIPDSKTPTGVGEVPLTDLAVEAFRDQIWLTLDQGRGCFRAVGISAATRRASRRSGAQRWNVRAFRTSGSTICARHMQPV